MQDRAVKEGFQPLKKASTMPTSPRARPVSPPSPLPNLGTEHGVASNWHVNIGQHGMSFLKRMEYTK